MGLIILTGNIETIYKYIETKGNKVVDPTLIITSDLKSILDAVANIIPVT